MRILLRTEESLDEFSSHFTYIEFLFFYDAKKTIAIHCINFREPKCFQFYLSVRLSNIVTNKPIFLGQCALIFLDSNRKHLKLVKKL